MKVPISGTGSGIGIKFKKPLSPKITNIRSKMILAINTDFFS